VKPGSGGADGRLTAADRAQVAHIRAYPWASGPLADDPDGVGRALAAGAVAVLAYGANASPAVLAAKLGPAAAAGVVAAAATLAGHDVVFSAHVSAHGAIPATLHPAPGTEVAVALLALTPSSLARLDATEPNYRRGLVAGVSCSGRPALPVQAYRSRHGALRLGGTPVALVAVPARARGLPALAEAELLERIRAWLEPGADPDAFVLAGAREPGVRAARTRRLRATVTPPDD